MDNFPPTNNDLIFTSDGVLIPEIFNEFPLNAFQPNDQAPQLLEDYAPTSLMSSETTHLLAENNRPITELRHRSTSPPPFVLVPATAVPSAAVPPSVFTAGLLPLANEPGRSSLSDNEFLQHLDKHSIFSKKPKPAPPRSMKTPAPRPPKPTTKTTKKKAPQKKAQRKVNDDDVDEKQTKLQRQVESNRESARRCRERRELEAKNAAGALVEARKAYGQLEMQMLEQTKVVKQLQHELEYLKKRQQQQQSNVQVGNARFVSHRPVLASMVLESRLVGFV